MIPNPEIYTFWINIYAYSESRFFCISLVSALVILFIMSRSPDPRSTTTFVGSSSRIRVRSVSPPSSSSCIRDRTSPMLLTSRNKSPHSDVIRKGSTYPIVIPTIRNVPPLSRSPDSRRSRSPVPSCVPVITTGRRGSTPSAAPSSSSPRRERSPSSPEGLMSCNSPSEDILGMHRPVHLTYDAKLCREISPSPVGRRVSTAESASSSVPDSRQLKFGMERILSEEMSPVIRRHQHQG